MFCMNCGKKLSDNEKFCANCGWPAGQDAGKINGDGAREAGFPSPDAPAMNPLPGGGDDGFGAAPQRVSPGTGGTSPKKNLARALFLMMVGAAVAIAIITGLPSRAVNFFRRTFSSPQSYFQDVMKKALQDEAKILANNYNNLIREPLNIGDKSISGQITVNLGDEGRELIETAGYPEDLGWLQQVTLALELSSKNDSLSGDAALHLGKNELISGNAIYFQGFCFFQPYITGRIPQSVCSPQESAGL